MFGLFGGGAKQGDSAALPEDRAGFIALLSEKDEEIGDLRAKVEALSEALHKEDMDHFEMAIAEKNKVLEEMVGELQQVKSQNEQLKAALAPGQEDAYTQLAAERQLRAQAEDLARQAGHAAAAMQEQLLGLQQEAAQLREAQATSIAPAATPVAPGDSDQVTSTGGEVSGDAASAAHAEGQDSAATTDEASQLAASQAALAEAQQHQAAYAEDAARVRDENTALRHRLAEAIPTLVEAQRNDRVRRGEAVEAIEEYTNELDVAEHLGAIFGPRESRELGHGWQAVRLREGSWAERNGVKDGDELHKINGQLIEVLPEEEVLYFLRVRPITLSWVRRTTAAESGDPASAGSADTQANAEVSNVVPSAPTSPPEDDHSALLQQVKDAEERAGAAQREALTLEERLRLTDQELNAVRRALLEAQAQVQSQLTEAQQTTENTVHPQNGPLRGPSEEEEKEEHQQHLQDAQQQQQQLLQALANAQQSLAEEQAQTARLREDSETIRHALTTASEESTKQAEAARSTGEQLEEAQQRLAEMELSATATTAEAAQFKDEAARQAVHEAERQWQQQLTAMGESLQSAQAEISRLQNEISDARVTNEATQADAAAVPGCLDVGLGAEGAVGHEAQLVDDLQQLKDALEASQAAVRCAEGVAEETKRHLAMEEEKSASALSEVARLQDMIRSVEDETKRLREEMISPPATLPSAPTNTSDTGWDMDLLEVGQTSASDDQATLDSKTEGATCEEVALATQAAEEARQRLAMEEEKCTAAVAQIALLEEELRASKDEVSRLHAAEMPSSSPPHDHADEHGASSAHAEIVRLQEELRVTQEQANQLRAQVMKAQAQTQPGTIISNPVAVATASSDAGWDLGLENDIASTANISSISAERELEALKNECVSTQQRLQAEEQNNSLALEKIASLQSALAHAEAEASALRNAPANPRVVPPPGSGAGWDLDAQGCEISASNSQSMEDMVPLQVLEACRAEGRSAEAAAMDAKQQLAVAEGQCASAASEVARLQEALKTAEEQASILRAESTKLQNEAKLSSTTPADEGSGDAGWDLDFGDDVAAAATAVPSNEHMVPLHTLEASAKSAQEAQQALALEEEKCASALREVARLQEALRTAEEQVDHLRETHGKSEATSTAPISESAADAGWDLDVGADIVPGADAASPKEEMVPVHLLEASTKVAEETQQRLALEQERYGSAMSEVARLKEALEAAEAKADHARVEQAHIDGTVPATANETRDAGWDLDFGDDMGSSSAAPPKQDMVPLQDDDSACQYQFKPDEETYRCLDCEITEDCPVLCRNCFDASEHKNHRWEMLRDEGGGWCDCGDRTAWREPFVFCQFHAPKYEQPTQQTGMPYPVAGGNPANNSSYGNPPPYGQQY